MLFKREVVISSKAGLRNFTLHIWQQVMIATLLFFGVSAFIYFLAIGVARFTRLKEIYDEVTALRSVNGGLNEQVEAINKELSEIARDLRRGGKEKPSSTNAKIIGYYKQAIDGYAQSRHVASSVFVDLNAKVGALTRTVQSVGLEPLSFLKGDGKEKLQQVRTVPYSTKMTINHIVENYKHSKAKYLFRSAFLEDDDRQLPTMRKGFSLLDELQTLVNHLPINSPLSTFRITCRYGGRFHPVHGHYHMHTGIDIRGPNSSPVIATGLGKVVFAGVKKGFGNTVDIDHGYGIISRFGHLDNINVKNGEKVQVGTSIGIQGCTGTVTAEHLHYEVRYHNKTINPIKFIYASRDVGNIITASK